MPPAARARGRPGDRMESAPEPKTAFQFPRMPFDEIQVDMDQFNHPITREVFRDPSANTFKDVSDFFIQEIYEKRSEDFGQPGFGCLDFVDNPDLYEDAIPKLQYFRQAQQMFFDANFPEFCIRDIHAPEKTRFHWQISAMINFMKFRQSRLALFEEITANADDLAEKENRSIADRSGLEHEIAEIETLRSQDEPEVETLRELVADLGLKLSSLHKQQLELAEHTRETKAALSESMEYAAALKVKRMAETEEIDQLRPRVVASPDRIQSEMGRMQSTVETETENISSMEKRSRSLRQRAAASNKCAQEIDKVISTAETVVAQQERVRELREENERAKETLKERENEANESLRDKEHLERVAVSVQMKLNRMREQGDEYELLHANEDRSWEEKEAALVQEATKYLRIEQEKQSESKAVQERLLEEVLKFKKTVDNFEKKQDKALERFDEYRSDIERARELISADSQEALQSLASVAREALQIPNSVMSENDNLLTLN